MSMISSLRHIALVVPDLRAAEGYYRCVFGMGLIGREAELADGLWYTLPLDKGWDEAEAAGIKLDMVGLRKAAFVLALFRGLASPGQVAFIGVQMPQEEVVGIRARLPEETLISGDDPTRLEFTDPYQITWQIFPPGDEFRTAGDWASRWLML